MWDSLGPRAISYVAPDGHSGEIVISIHRIPPREVDLGAGCVIQESGASVTIASDWFYREMTSYANDDIQCVFRLLCFSDIYVQKICRDKGYIVFKNVEGDVTEDLDIYR